MDIVIAATLVDTLRYRLYAQTLLPATAAADGHAERARRPAGRDRLAVASLAPPVGPREAGRRERERTPPAAECVAMDGELRSGAWASVPPAQWSAAVRALRERTYREVLTQIEHFIRTTGRDWQIQTLDYGQASADGAAASGAAARLTLVTEVVLAARVPRLH